MLKRPELMDLYSDFLASSPNIASASVFAAVLNNSYSHDAITRMLAQPELDQQSYWRSIKKQVRALESDQGSIAVDDFLEHKPHSRENELISWHFDHASGHQVKGINIVTFTYVNRDLEPSVKLPIAYELVRKDLTVTKMVKDKAKGKFIEKTTRQASVGKNELLRTRLKILTHQNNVRFAYVTFDSWYASAENMVFIVQNLHKHFVCALKDNRSIRFEQTDPAQASNWLTVSQAELEPDRVYKVYLKDVPFPVLLVKKVFTHLNGTIGVQYLVTSDTELAAPQLSTIYKDRWSSEEVHRSLKQNTALEKMPAKMERSQANHIFAAMIALTKLEGMKRATKTNHYTLKRQILIKALQQAWLQIQQFKELCTVNKIDLPNFLTA